jgi:hypothetical protein
VSSAAFIGGMDLVAGNHGTTIRVRVVELSRHTMASINSKNTMNDTSSKIDHNNDENHSNGSMNGDENDKQGEESNRNQLK